MIEYYYVASKDILDDESRTTINFFPYELIDENNPRQIIAVDLPG